VINALELVPSSSTAHGPGHEDEDELPAQPDERLWLSVPEGHYELARIPTFGEPLRRDSLCTRRLTYRPLSPSHSHLPQERFNRSRSSRSL
jgi:hypothetical protein